jgi:predicted transcriptional regulator
LSNRHKNELRQERVLELTSKGYSQRQIASMLNVANGTVAYDQLFLKQQAKQNIKKYIDERLPEEYEKCLVGLNAITREAWNTEDKREKIQALSLAKECYSMKLDMLTNASVVDDAIRFVSQRSKDNEQYKRSNENEYEYDADKVQLEEGQEEEETAEVATTTNQVF